MDYTKGVILNLITSGDAFTVITDEMTVAIPIFLKELRNNYLNLDMVHQMYNILKRHYPVKQTTIQLINKFNDEYEDLKTQQRIMEYAEALPEIQRLKQSEIDALADSLSEMLDPMASLTSGIRRAGISKRKTPSKKKRTV
jgi:hypothetical protein